MKSLEVENEKPRRQLDHRKLRSGEWLQCGIMKIVDDSNCRHTLQCRFRSNNLFMIACANSVLLESQLAGCDNILAS